MLFCESINVDRLTDFLSLTRIIHENFCCNRQLPAISSRARSLRFDVL
jgi:hypothetical protein